MNNIRMATKNDISRIAEIFVVNYRMNFYQYFHNDKYYFGELNVLSIADEYKSDSEKLVNTFVYDDGIVRGFMRIKEKEIEKLKEETKNNDKITLNIAFNYGSRAEIVDAVNRIIKDGKENITEEDFSKYLYNDFPDPDLVIRTSGEMRISNFLLWQIAYSEFYITDTLWPDFDEKEIDKAIESYNQRERRFGGVKNV